MFSDSVQGQNETPLRVFQKAEVILNVSYFMSTQNQLSMTSQTSGPVCLQTAREHLHESSPHSS